eukprot:1006306-Pleurochrysis_carterae.AAC.1
MGHRQGFTAIYADGGICGISPTARPDLSDQQLCFTRVVPVATTMETIIYMGLRAILECRSW